MAAAPAAGRALGAEGGLWILNSSGLLGGSGKLQSSTDIFILDPQKKKNLGVFPLKR